MSHEVDLRAVGGESKSGDSIVLRYGDFSARETYRLVVIDGGFLDCGQDIVNHIGDWFKTDLIDLVISTHPDGDHVSGLRTVLEQLRVRQLAMHRPWLTAESVKAYLRASHVTPPASLNKFHKSLATAKELEELAIAKHIPIVEPFAGLTFPDGSLHVLGPSQEYYASLLPSFDQSAALGLTGFMKTAVRKGMQVVQEQWYKDELFEPAADDVSAINNSSVITYLDFGGHTFLFTGDAGVPALIKAAGYAASQGIDLAKVHSIQVPHHGSKRNVGPIVLDYLFGPIAPEGTTTGKRAFISAANDASPKHPSKRVTNALVRRGANVFCTSGSHHHYFSGDIGLRPGWSAVTPVPFHHTHDEEV